MKMKQYVLLCLIIIAGVLIPSKSIAQFRISNTTNIELLGGYASGRVGGWNFGIGSEFVLGSSEHSILVRALYSNTSSIISTSMSTEKFTVEEFVLSTNYMYSLCKFITAPINLGFFGGINLGHSSFPNNVKNITISNQAGFMYGISAGCELEVFIVKGFSAFISPQLSYYFNDGQIKPFSFLGNVGFKIRL